MGTWGIEPWANDDAADWYAGFWTAEDKPGYITSAILTAEPEDDEGELETVRAASHLLAALGRVYIWPIERIDEARAAVDRAIQLLTQAISPEDPYGFLDLWDDDPEIKEAIEFEIGALKEIQRPGE